VSIPVGLDEIAARIDELGTAPYLVTVGEKGPHVVSVAVSLDGDRFSTSVGRHTEENLAAGNPATLLWPAPPGADYALIVDVVGPAGALEPMKAVLHRVSTADGSLPNCIRLDGR
jgi:hypothetical protein